MVKTLKYTVDQIEEVLEDISALQNWYEDIAGVESAIRFQTAIEETIASLENNPETHGMFDDDPKVRRINMKDHNVAIIYYVDNDVYEVIAVKAFHTMQDPIKTRAFLEQRIESARRRLA